MTPPSRRARRPTIDMGMRLHRTFLDAGLPAPQLRHEAPIGGGPTWPGLHVRRRDGPQPAAVLVQTRCRDRRRGRHRHARRPPAGRGRRRRRRPGAADRRRRLVPRGLKPRRRDGKWAPGRASSCGDRPPARRLGRDDGPRRPLRHDRDDRAGHPDAGVRAGAAEHAGPLGDDGAVRRPRRTSSTRTSGTPTPTSTPGCGRWPTTCATCTASAPATGSRWRCATTRSGSSATGRSRRSAPPSSG